MSYKKGQILTYTFPKLANGAAKSKVIENYHRAVVLHKRETPFKTILIAPITKAGSLKSKGSIPSNYVELKKTDYPLVLDEDSFINLDMTLPVDEAELEGYEKRGFKVTSQLHEFDLYQLDYKITLTYELNKYLKTEFALELNEQFENVITFIDEDIKIQIEQVLSRISDQEVFNDVVSLIDLLLSQIKEIYINSDVKTGKYLEEK